ncbi:low temperature requirement protein A [Lacisediminihabitans sp.]|uniref:low temperature requirement protein A n=1 Tax=Lacisediminihabitans sp. TaxID=2787631 RepID=UPI00374CFBD9
MSPSAPQSDRRAWERPVLRDDGDRHRPVGWVELFFDLVFVVIVSVLAHDLAGHAGADGLLRFGLQFVGVIWVWNAFTYYTERFESHGLENRLFTFIAILAVAGLAVWGEDGLGHNYAGFVGSYFLARGLNITLWLRAGAHERRFRRAALGFAGGFVVALALLALSFFVSDGARLAMWAAAVAVEIATPAVTNRFQTSLPQISRDKFPERFGLLTLIVLGETVAGVIRGVATANETAALSVATVVDAALGLAIGFGLWWVYFDFIARRPTRPSFNAALVWVYLHIAMLTGVVVVGVAVGEVLTATPGEPLPGYDRALLFVGLGLTLVVICLLELTLDRAADEPTHAVISPTIKAVTGVALALAALIPLDPLTALLVCVLALAVSASYGARVYYRR